MLTTDIQQFLVLGRLCVREKLLSNCPRQTFQEPMGRIEKQDSEGNLGFHKFGATGSVSLNKPQTKVSGTHI